jgi:hypothetical protein
VVIHDIEMDDIGAGSQYIVDFLAQPGEVGGQDRWRDAVAGLGHGTGLLN